MHENLEQVDSAIAKALEHIVALFNLADLRLKELEKRIIELEEIHVDKITTQQ